jgi:hypothetical protein
MTAAATRTFPGPRAYHNWLRELSSLQPRRLWLSHLLVHRVEALVAVARPGRLETFPLALLRRLFVSTSSAAVVAALERLHFDRQFVLPLLRELTAAGLLHADGGTWTLTAAGQQALQQDAYTHRVQERRVFYFVDNPGGAPRYLPLTHTAGPVVDLGGDWIFEPAHLRDCVQRATVWKQRIGFPVDVEAVLDEPAEDWRQVILDRAEHAPLLFVETSSNGEGSLLGFLVRCDNWALQREPPALTLRTDWHELLPDFAESFSQEAWREAWWAWYQTRQLPAADATAWPVEYADCKVRVKASKAFVEQLKAARHEVLRGETWLTIGAGRTRAAALLEIREQE